MAGTKDEIILLSGNNNNLFAKTVSDLLKIPLTKSTIGNFSDGEVQIEILENIRGGDVFVIVSAFTDKKQSVNDRLVRLMLLVDAAKRSSAKRITAVMPYYSYARQDKKVAPRVPISAKAVADMLEAVGANRIITMDLHAPQIQGFFNIPVDNLWSMPLFLKYIREQIMPLSKRCVLVSADVGGAERVRAFASKLGLKMAIIDKRRSASNKAKAMNLIGRVKNMTAVIIDDMVDTAGTLTEAAEMLLKKGASEVYALCAHPILSGAAIKLIEESLI